MKLFSVVVVCMCSETGSISVFFFVYCQDVDPPEVLLFFVYGSTGEFLQASLWFYREVCRRSSANATTGTNSLFAFPIQEHPLTCLCISSNRALYNYLSNPLMFIIATISILAVLFFVFAHSSLLNTNCSMKCSCLNRS
jgi:hypothetical protein